MAAAGVGPGAASLVIFLLTATIFPLGFSIPTHSFALSGDVVGTDYISNRLTAGSVTIRMQALSGSSPRPDLGFVSLGNGLDYYYSVIYDITSITTWFKLTNSTGSYDQKVVTWSIDPNVPTVEPCGTDCEWTVDSEGMWVTNPTTSNLDFVTGWNGPH